MDRRRTIAAAGAISLVATATVVALGSGIGLFGLDDSGSSVGKLSPIDATHQVSHRAGDDAATTSSTVPGPLTTVSTAPGEDVGDDHGVDPAGHDANDDHGVDPAGPAPTTATTAPRVDDHGGSSNRGPGSGGSGSGDNRGPGSSSSGSGPSGSGHDDD